MRLVHFSDMHLGFRAFPEQEGGWNRRERDVASAFQRAIEGAARLAPDLVLLSGDIFDRPNPPSSAFLTMTRGIRTLQALVPGVTVLAIAGRRDTPGEETDPGPVAVLDALAGVRAAAVAARAVRIPERGLHALLVPWRAAHAPALPDFRPDPQARFNVLLARGLPGEGTDGVAFDPGGWDYVAIGGSHEASAGDGPHGERIRVAGSLERVGWDPWREATVEKGFIHFDLERGEGEFHPVSVRPVVDLAPVRAERGAPGEGSRRLRHLVETLPGGVADKLVRVRLQGDLVLPEEGVEPGLLEGIRRRAAHLEIRIEAEEDAARSPVQGTGPPGSGDGRARGWAPYALPARDGGEIVIAPGIHLVDPRAHGRLRRVLLESAAAGGVEGVGRLLLAGGAPQELLEAALALVGVGERAEDHDEDQTGSRAESRAEPALADPAEGGGSAGAADAGRDSLEGELRALRGDAVEAEGEVEARTLEWARDRQEAETRLQSYRDRARELRRRIRDLDSEEAPCPTCGRVLGDGRELLLATLRDEWEMVVQDGRWWKRRREQLEERPQDLREMENRALRLRAEVSDLASALERSRYTSSDPEDHGRTDRPVVPEALLRPFLRRASGVLRLWSEGRLSGLVRDEAGRLAVVERGGARPPSAAEESGMAIALHLALRELVNGGGGGRGGPLLPGAILLRAIDDRGLDPLVPVLEAFRLDTLRVFVLVPAGIPFPETPHLRGVLVADGPEPAFGARLTRGT